MKRILDLKYNWLLLVLSLLFSCSLPIKDIKDDKKVYLEDFSDFVEKVSEESEEFCTEEWRKADSMFVYYSRTLYSEFRNELSEKDLEQIGAYKLKFYEHRCLGALGSLKKGAIQMRGAIKSIMDEESDQSYNHEDFDKNLNKTSLNLGNLT